MKEYSVTQPIHYTFDLHGAIAMHKVISVFKIHII